MIKEATIAVGTDGHCCTHLKEKRHCQKSAARQSCMQKWTFLSEIGSKNDQSFCHVHNVMIQKKLHIPGEMERASLVTDESWREVSWW
jgi:hypothetical protein